MPLAYVNTIGHSDVSMASGLGINQMWTPNSASATYCVAMIKSPPL